MVDATAAGPFFTPDGDHLVPAPHANSPWAPW